MENEKYKIEFELSIFDFKHAIGGEPENKEELNKFYNLYEKGLKAQIHWNTIYNCAKEEIGR